MRIDSTYKPKISPSELMRSRRPENYSDSEFTSAYSLEKAAFSFYLNTITDRNEHKVFEEFCRALAQREICPNLRPQTGPEGGGDGKVDSENYIVSDEVSDNWFEADANAGQQKWAFAMSAQEKWAPKVKSDVKGITSTGRHYDRIYFFTNRAAKQRVRLKIEQELTKEYGLPVTIFDRLWIEDKVFVNQHFDLAHNFFGIGSHNPHEVKLGPNDFRRERELSEIENRFSRDDYDTHFEKISDSLYAAKLSRGLERPRFETDGRFDRAIRLAKKHGSFDQHLEAKYEKIWTALWWFDDFAFADDQYDDFEKFVFASHLSAHVSKVGNVLQMLVNAGTENEQFANRFKIDERGERLRNKLESIVSDKSARNNSLYAETLLQFQVINENLRNKQNEKLDDVWIALKAILVCARGYAEYPVQMLDELVNGLADFDFHSEAFDDLLMTLAEFMGERHQEARQGQVYFRRGEQKLLAGRPDEAVSWLGKASLAFLKKEYDEQQFRSLFMLSVAYHNAGLLWAARATCLSALTVISTKNHEDGEIQIESFAAAKLLAQITLELSHLPDLFEAIRLLNFYLQSVSLTDDSIEKLQSDIAELDQLLMCSFLGFDDSAMDLLAEVPSLLDYLQLYLARTGLLYRLGYIDDLKADGSFPAEESAENFHNTIELVASQPAAYQVPDNPILNSDAACSISSIILGCSVEFSCASKSYLIAAREILLSSLEGFSATLINRRVIAHTNKVLIEIVESEGPLNFSITSSPHDLKVIVNISEDLDLGSHEHTEVVNRAVLEFCALTINLFTIADNIIEIVHELLEEERLFERSVLFSNVLASHSRVFGSPIGRLSNFYLPEPRSYPRRKDAPEIKRTRPDFEMNPTATYPYLKRHSDIQVHSVINLHLWNDAGWKGMAYASYGPDCPPILGLFFKNKELGKKIFQQWRERFGNTDTDEVIRVSILQGINKNATLHYRAHISQKFGDDEDTFDKSRLHMSLSRYLEMTPETSQHLDFFLQEYARLGSFLFAPVDQADDGSLMPDLTLGITKRELIRKPAWTIGLHDQDNAVIQETDDVVVPEGVDTPPVSEVIALKRKKTLDSGE
ncbi:hypothetical protein [Ponticaulis koreensis]|uniref:hypothetical protein n=1 Tax=Ponticaulis koreensis TaxID=1123045 RepID=UPI0004155E20|nr:hypothetical protein [Ponticaulis koreensis]